MRFNRLFSTCGLAALLGTTAVHAQAGSDDPAVAAEPESGEIVITARRRAERIQDVPVAITAFSQEQLAAQGVRNVADLARITPGFNATASAGGGKARPVLELRGIYTGDVLAGQDQAIGLYVNEVYIARPIGTNQSIFDVENVQVLYGPQGTLFGRNTTGGALLLSTKRPTENFEAEAWIGAGNYDWRQFGAVLNLPVADTVQLRLAGQQETRDGYTINILNNQDLDDENNYALRGSLRFAPADGIESITIADYFHSRTHQQGGVLTQFSRPGDTFTLADGRVIPFAATLFNSYPGLPAAAAEQAARGPWRVAYDVDQEAVARHWGISNLTTVRLTDEITLKNVDAYLRNLSDSDKTPFPGLQGAPTLLAKQFSEELQLQGTALDKRLTWIVGGFYFRERGHETTVSSSFGRAASFSQSTVDFYATNISKSVFAQATYRLLDGLNLTAGRRYNSDTRKLLYNNPRILQRGNPPTVPVGIAGCNMAADMDPDRNCIERRSATFKEPTYTLTLDYHPTRDTMVYVTHRRGYRSGGYNGRATTAIAATPFRPEIITDVEVGAKGDFLLGGDVRLTADIALYRMKYDNLQRSVVVPNPTTGQPTTVIVNAASATIEGFEAKANLHLGRAVQLSANWSHNNGTYDRFTGILACPVLNTPCTSAQRVIGTSRNLPFGTVKDTVNATLSVVAYDNPEAGRITASAGMSHRGRWFQQTELPVLASPISAYTIANFGVDWQNIGGSALSGRAFVQNAFDKTYVASGLAVLNSSGFADSYYGEPRTYGLSLRYQFGGR